MNLLGDNYSPRSYRPLIRFISLLVLIAFLFQDFAWAITDAGSDRYIPAKPHTVQIQSLFSSFLGRKHLTAGLLSRIIESSVADKNDLTVAGIESVLRILDTWKENAEIIYQWHVDRNDAGYPVDLVITFPDRRSRPYAKLRYFTSHPDPAFTGSLPSPWKETPVDQVNPTLRRQITRVDISENAPEKAPVAAPEDIHQNIMIKGDVRDLVSVYDDYFITVFPSVLELFSNTAMRKKIKRENTGDLLEAAPVFNRSFEIIDLAEKATSKFKTRISGFFSEVDEEHPAEYFERHFRRFKELISLQDEAEAELILRDILNRLFQEKQYFLTRKTQQVYSSRLKLYKKNTYENKVITMESGYYKSSAGTYQSTIKRRQDVYFQRRWMAERSLNEIEESLMAELDRVRENILELKAVLTQKDPSHMGPAYLKIRQMFYDLEGVRTTEKQHLRKALETAFGLMEIRQTDTVEDIIFAAERLLSLREKNINTMLEYIMSKRRKPLRNIVRQENSEFARRARDVRAAFESGEYHEAAQEAHKLLARMAYRLGGRNRAERDEYYLKAFGLLDKYAEKLGSKGIIYIDELSEPDLKGARPVISAISGKMEKLKDRAPHKTEASEEEKDRIKRSAEKWLNILEKKIHYSTLLNDFLEGFQERYIDIRSKQKRPFIKEDTFIDYFGEFVSANGMEISSPETKAFEMLCYSAVFIPLEIKNPTGPGKRINPLIEPLAAMRLIVSVDDIGQAIEIISASSLKNTIKYLKKFHKNTFLEKISQSRDRVSEFTLGEKTGLIKAISRDFALTEERRFEIAKASSITKSNMRRTYRSSPGRTGVSVAFIDWITGWFIDRGLITQETAARFSFLTEEAIFSWMLMSFFPWALAPLGTTFFADVRVLYLLSVFFFSVSHQVLYRWHSHGSSLSGTDDAGSGTKGLVLLPGPAPDVVNYLGFALLGAVFRSFYLFPGVSPLAGFVAAMALHAFYNNILAPRFSLPAAMVRQPSRKAIDFFRGFPITLRGGYFMALSGILVSTGIVAIIYQNSLAPVFTAFVGGLTVFFITRFLEIARLNYYSDISNVSDVLHSVSDRGESDPEKEKEKLEVNALFRKILSVYKSYFVSDLVQKRKKLFAVSLLSNIKPEGAPGSSLGSSLRSEVVTDLVINEVLASNDVTVYQPALEAMIEMMAKEKQAQRDFFFRRYFPLLKKSDKLPRFARALIDELIKAEHGDIDFFYIENKVDFFDETKEIIKILAVDNPDLKKEIMGYLFEVAHKSKKEIPLVRSLLEDLNFRVVSSDDFPRVSAGLVATEINRLQKELPRPVNVVFTAGNTMSKFLDELAVIPGVDWTMVNVFQVSEYRGLGPEDGHSIAHFLNRKLFSKAGIPPENIHCIGGAPDLMSYMRDLKEKGGADIFVLGLGNNGQVAFNEPGKEMKGGRGLVEARLSDITVRSRKNDYPELAENPWAYTMALDDIFSSDARFFVFATGEDKSDIVKRVFFGPVTADNPASRFQEYGSRTSVLFDKGAIGESGSDIVDKYAEAIRKQKNSEEMYRQLFDEAPVGYHVLDRDGVIIRINPKEAEMLGYTVDEMLGKPIFEFIPPDEREAARKNFRLKLSPEAVLKGFDRKYRKKDGSAIWFRIENRHLFDEDGIIVGMRSTLQDITPMRKMQEDLEKSLFIDPLTGAFNYKFVEEKIPGLYSRINATGEKAALMIIDIEGLSGINSLYGHAAGHKALRELASSILSDIDKEKELMIREFGDEIALLMRKTSSAASALRALSIIKKISEKKLKIDENTEITIKINIGLANKQKDESFVSLFSRAEGALSQAKKNPDSRLVSDSPIPGEHNFLTDVAGKISAYGPGLLLAGIVTVSLARYILGETEEALTGFAGSLALLDIGIVMTGEEDDEDPDEEDTYTEEEPVLYSDDETEENYASEEILSLIDKWEELKGEEAASILRDIIRSAREERKTEVYINTEIMLKLLDILGSAVEREADEYIPETSEEKEFFSLLKEVFYGFSSIDDGDDTLLDPAEEEAISLWIGEIGSSLEELEKKRLRNKRLKNTELREKIELFDSLYRALEETISNSTPYGRAHSYVEDKDHDDLYMMKMRSLSDLIKAAGSALDFMETNVGHEELLGLVKPARGILLKMRFMYPRKVFPELYYKGMAIGALDNRLEKMIKNARARSLGENRFFEEGDYLADPDIAVRIRRAMISSGLSNNDIVGMTGTHKANVWSYLNGKAKPTWSFIRKVSEALGLDRSHLLFGTSLEEALCRVRKPGMRLKMARVYLGYDQRSLDAFLREKYGISTGQSAISLYEGIGTERGQSPAEMNLEYSRALAELTGVDHAILLFGRPILSELKETEGSGQKMKKIRMYLGLDQKRSAAMYGIKPDTYHRYERRPDGHRRTENMRSRIYNAIAAVTGIAPEHMKDGSSIIGAMLIASVSGLLLTALSPYLGTWAKDVFSDSVYLLFIYGAFIAGAVTVWALDKIDGIRRTIALENREAELAVHPISTGRILVLDDRENHRKQLRKLYGEAELLVEASSIEEAAEAIEKNDRFDLVISDLCLSPTMAGSFKKVNFKDNDVEMRRAGEAFVLWLKDHPKTPGTIILHSTMFNPFGLDNLVNSVTGYRPSDIRKRVEPKGIKVHPKKWTIKPHPHSAKTYFMWSGIIGLISALDLSVFARYISPGFAMGAAPFMAATVLFLSARGIVSIRKDKKTDTEKMSENAAEAKMPDTDTMEEVLSSVEVPVVGKTEQDTTADLETVLKNRAVKDLEDQSRQALDLLEKFSRGDLAEATKLADAGYKVFTYYQGKGPEKEEVGPSLFNTALELGFSRDRAQKIADSASLQSRLFQSSDTSRIEIIMFRTVYFQNKAGIELIIRSYAPGAESEWSREENTFGDVNVDTVRNGRISEGVRMLARAYPALVSEQEIRDFIDVLEISGEESVPIYSRSGKKIFDMESGEFIGKAFSRAGILPVRKKGEIIWVSDTSSGGLFSFQEPGSDRHKEIFMDKDIVDNFEALWLLGMISLIKETMTASGYITFIDAGVDSDPVLFADSVYRSARGIAALAGFDHEEADEIAMVARREAQREKKADLGSPAVIMMKEIKYGTSKGIEIISRERGNNQDGIEAENLTGMDVFIVDSMDNRMIHAYGYSDIAFTDRPIGGTRIIARRFVPYKTLLKEDSRMKVSPEMARVYKGEALVMVPTDKGTLAIMTQEQLVHRSKRISTLVPREEKNDIFRKLGPVSRTVRLDAKGRIRIPREYSDRLISQGYWQEEPVSFKIYRKKDNFEIVPVYGDGLSAVNAVKSEKDIITAKAAEAALILKQGIQTFGRGLDEKKEQGFIILDIPQSQSNRVRTAIEDNIIKPLEQLLSPENELVRSIRGLRIVNGQRIDFVRKKIKSGDIRPENVIMVTSRDIERDLEGFGDAFVTSLDGSLLDLPQGIFPDDYYYPYLEALVFTLIRAAGADDYETGPVESRERYGERLWQWYSRIPNVEKVNKEDFIARSFRGAGLSKVSRSFTLRLTIPEAVTFDPVEIYEAIREFLIKA